MSNESLGEMLTQAIQKYGEVTPEGINIKSADGSVTKLPFKEKELDKEEKSALFQMTYEYLIEGLKKYSDIKERYYSLIALWIMGTYFHNEFPTYPFLFLNAMKGSGKSRLLKLITYLSKEDQMLTSVSEAVLFRTTGTLGIDEFENATNKNSDNLRELLNACYKKGNSVKRMQKCKVDGKEDYEVKEFEVYRPICMANINGMESVTGDRCIQIVLERSNCKFITRRMEMFDIDPMIQNIKKLLIQCSLCSSVYLQETYIKWDEYLTHNYTNYTNNTNYTNYTNYTNPSEKLLIESLDASKLNGRELEISFPLVILSSFLGETTLKLTITTLTNIMQERREDDSTENHDISLMDYLSQELENCNFIPVKDLTLKFQQFVGVRENDDVINVKWIGRALKRLNLIIEKRRLSRGIEVILDYKKAREKIKQLK